MIKNIIKFIYLLKKFFSIKAIRTQKILEKKEENIKKFASKIEELVTKNAELLMSNTAYEKISELSRQELLFLEQVKTSLEQALELSREEHKKVNEELRKKVKELENLNKNLENIVQERTREIERKNRRLEELVIIDDLTGLYNYRYFSRTVKDLLSKEKIKFSLVILDLDNFKIANDHYSHLFGDFILTRLAYLLKTSIRSNDIAGRYGGDEFMLLFFRTDAKTIQPICQKIIDNFCELKINSIDFKNYVNKYEKNRYMNNNEDKYLHEIEKKVDSINNKNLLELGITISMGVTSYKEKDTISSIFSRADTALYEAKKKGKNQLVIY